MTDQEKVSAVAEIGQLFQELYDEAGAWYDQHCDEHSEHPDGRPAPRWNDYVRNVFEQLIERGLLVPRAEHDAAIAALRDRERQVRLEEALIWRPWVGNGEGDSTPDDILANARIAALSAAAEGKKKP